MRPLIAFMMGLTAGVAFAGEIAPRADAPDVVYIGEGWPADLTNGCFDRGECQLPEVTEAAKRTPRSADPWSAKVSRAVARERCKPGETSPRRMPRSPAA